MALSNRLIEALFLAVAALALLVLLRRGDTRPLAERVLLALMESLSCSARPGCSRGTWPGSSRSWGALTRRTVVAVAVALSLVASESLVTQLTSGLVLHTLARLSYDVYPVLALGFLVVLLAEVVRPVQRNLLVGKHVAVGKGTRSHRERHRGLNLISSGARCQGRRYATYHGRLGCARSAHRFDVVTCQSVDPSA